MATNSIQWGISDSVDLAQPLELDEPAVLDSAREAVNDHLDGKVIVRTIYVTDKVINFVVR